ncbi:MAG TPA: hypothetical protein V6D11_22975 [Waterburya sp.]
MNLTEAKQIAELAFHVYEKALEIYEQQSPPTSSQTGEIDFSKDVFTHWAMSTLEQLAIEREPLLLKFQNAD